jgi:hypothetical protein
MYFPLPSLLKFLHALHPRIFDEPDSAKSTMRVMKAALFTTRLVFRLRFMKAWARQAAPHLIHFACRNYFFLIRFISLRITAYLPLISVRYFVNSSPAIYPSEIKLSL